MEIRLNSIYLVIPKVDPNEILQATVATIVMLWEINGPIVEWLQFAELRRSCVQFTLAF